MQQQPPPPQIDPFIQQQQQQTQNSFSKYSCENCRQQHRKCDKQLPCCSRCVQSCRTCQYPTQPQASAAASAQSSSIASINKNKKKAGRPPVKLAAAATAAAAVMPKPVRAAAVASVASDSSVTAVGLSVQSQQIYQELSCLSLVESLYFGVLSLGHPMISMQDLGAVLMHHLRETGSQMTDLTDIKDYHCSLVHSIIALCLQRLGHRTAAWSCYERAESVMERLLSTYFDDGAGMGSTWQKMSQSSNSNRREDMRVIVFSIITMARFLLGTGKAKTAYSQRRDAYLKYAMSFLEYATNTKATQSSASESGYLGSPSSITSQSSVSSSSASSSLDEKTAVAQAAGMLALLRISEQSICCRTFSSIHQAILSRVNQENSAEKYPSTMVTLFGSLSSLIAEDHTYQSLGNFLAALDCVRSIFLCGQSLRIQQARPQALVTEVRRANWRLCACTIWLYCFYELLAALDHHHNMNQTELDHARTAVYEHMDFVGEQYLELLDEKCLQTLLAYCEPECAVYVASVLRYHLDRVIKSRLNSGSSSAAVSVAATRPQLPRNISSHLVQELRALKMLRERYEFVQQEYEDLIQLSETTLQLIQIEEQGA